MSPQELNKMIERIRGLPDELVIRVLKVCCRELDQRTEKRVKWLLDHRDKGKREP